MRATQISCACAATILTVLMTACGSEANTARQSPSPDETTTPGSAKELITPGGVALIVLDHLGPDTVRQVVTFKENEEGEGVGVMVRLRDRTPHNFAVSVYPPEQAQEFGPAGKCPPDSERERAGVPMSRPR